MGKKTFGKVKRESDSGQESYSVIKIQTEEVCYELDQAIANENDLIQYEFNLIELPFFSKDKKVADGRAKKYIFSKKDDSYIHVVPSGDPSLISNKIPQEMDEKIFYAVLKLSRDQGGKREVLTDYYTLAKVAGIDYKNLERIKDGLQRLRYTVVKINNLFYSKEKNGLLKGEKLDVGFFQAVDYFTLKDIVDLPDEKKAYYENYFKGRQISELIVITLHEKIYKNMENKGFLYFNQKKLLEIDNAVARKLYLLLTKWHGWEKKDTLRRSCRFLASRVPLSWEPANIHKTIGSLESALNILKEKNLIYSYETMRIKPLTDSFVDVQFANTKDDLVAKYNQAVSVKTGQENMIIDSIIDSPIQTNLFELMQSSDAANTPKLAIKIQPEEVPILSDYDKLIAMLPVQEQTDFIAGQIKKFFADKGFDFVESNIDYSLKNAKDNFSGFLIAALFQDFGQTLRLEKEKERVSDWFNGQDVETKANLFGSFSKKYGITKTVFKDLSETEMNQWRSFVFENCKSLGL